MAKKSEIKIVKRITMSQRGSGKGKLYPWDSIRIGQAFTVAYKRGDPASVKVVRAQAFNAGLKYERKFSVRQLQQGAFLQVSRKA